MPGELDDLDRGILALLQKGARARYVQIANRRGVLDATIHVRVRTLVNGEVIRRFTVLLDETKVGQSMTAYVLIRVEPGTIEQVCAALRRVVHIHDIYEIHEAYDVMVKVKGDCLAELREVLVNAMRPIPSVLGSEAYKTWKPAHAVPLS